MSQLAGRTMSGQHAVAGATVTLRAAGAAGYGSGDTVLGTAQSDPNGQWTIDYQCSSDDAQLYVVASGGDAGQGTNAALALSVAAGTCADVPQPLVVNEVTTVASVFALNAFLDSSGTHLGTSAGNPSGLANAAAMVLNLADTVSGQAQASLKAPASGTVPQATLNTLADILAACAGSSGAASDACTTLLNADSGAAATTLEAALRMARNPATAVASLYVLASSASPFQPILTTAPGDWLLPVTFSGGNPEAVAIDAQGNAWVSNLGPGVSEFSPRGVPLSGSTGFPGTQEESYGIAIDAAAHVWITNRESSPSINVGLGSITELAADGSLLSGASGYTSPLPADSTSYVSGILGPMALAVDLAGNIWIGNEGDGVHHTFVAELAPGGTFLSSANGFMGGGVGVASSMSLAVDAQNTIWVANEATNDVARLSGDGTALSPDAGYPLPAAVGICLDPDGRPWVTGGSVEAVALLQGSADASPGTPLSPAGGYTGGGLLHPAACASDGAGRIWIVNSDGASVTELAGTADPAPGAPLSGAQGFAVGLLLLPVGIAVDASGNVWVANVNNGSMVSIGFVTVLVGAATPVKTPLIGPPLKP